MRREPLAGLRRVLKVSRAGDGLLPAFVADHRDAIAAALGVDAARLVELDLEAPEGRGRLLAATTRAENQRASGRLIEADRRRSARTRELVEGARWREGVVDLPVAELFALAASAITPIIRFETESFVVHVERPRLARARAPLSRLPVPTAHLDESALHLRWRSGRGGLDLRSPAPAPRDPPAFVVRFESPRVTRPPVLLGQVLQDLGLTA